MKARDQQTRQLLGCGFEPPPAEHVRHLVQPWNGLGYSGPKPTVCPGYSTHLPEVIEAARAWFHWNKGALNSFARGVPSAALIDCIEYLDAAVEECKTWCMTPTSKGGGRD
jgi:hypothetical protein